MFTWGIVNFPPKRFTDTEVVTHRHTDITTTAVDTFRNCNAPQIAFK